MCLRAPKGHSRSLKSANEKKIIADKLPFVSRLAQHTLKPEVESRKQGSRPRPRTQKKSDAKAKDSLSEDRHFRGQGQECSRPRTKDTSASALKKKRSSQKFFRRSPQKNVFKKIFKRSPQNFNNSKNTAVLEPRTGQFSRT